MRIRRLAEDRIASVAAPLRRYRCADAGCGWEDAIAVDAGRRRRARRDARKNAQRPRRIAVGASLATGLLVALAGTQAWQLYRSALPDPVLERAAARRPLVPFGQSHDGEPLPGGHPLLVRVADARSADAGAPTVSDTARDAAANDAATMAAGAVTAGSVPSSTATSGSATSDSTASDSTASDSTASDPEASDPATNGSTTAGAATSSAAQHGAAGPDATVGGAQARDKSAPGGSAAAATASAADGAPLTFRQNCAWGEPGRNPYRGTVEQALEGARLPPEIAERLAAMIRAGQATDRLEITTASIRTVRQYREYDPSSIAMTFGKTLCVNTRVNFKPGHMERADLYEVADASGATYSVMVPYVCGNVSVLSDRAEAPDAKAAAPVMVLGPGGRPVLRKASAPLPGVIARNLRVGPDTPATTRQTEGQVPVPGTLANLLGGGALLAWLMRRRANKREDA